MFSLLYTASRPTLALTQPPADNLCSGLKRPENGTSQYLVSRLRMHLTYTSTYPYVFIVWCLIKHKFTGTFLTVILHVKPCDLVDRHKDSFLLWNYVRNFVIYQTTWRHIPENCNFVIHCRKNFRSRSVLQLCMTCNEYCRLLLL
jgi:hypothetical protein